MGDGREIVNNADGKTNNTFYQGNPFNTLLSLNNFGPSSPYGAKDEAIAFNYSGTYPVNINMGAATTGYEITGAYGGRSWVNLVIVDPTQWNSKATLPNHAIFTVPVFLTDITQIDANAILQLGDGTVGNDVASKTLTINGQPLTSRYCDSMGNAMLVTLGNQALLGSAEVTNNFAVTFSIVDNGQLIVNNTPGALSATITTGNSAGVSATVAAWVNANELDGISGVGSVTQMGSMPLTLGSPAGNPNSYSGGTAIGVGATLIAASASALGAQDATVNTPTGAVVNHGILEAASTLYVINVPGNFSQSAATNLGP